MLSLRHSRLFGYSCSRQNQRTEGKENGQMWLFPHRVWALIWGAILTFSFSMIPTFRHFRVMSFIGIIGTAYTAVFIVASAAIQGFQV